ncbi:vitelline membrane protein Vm26Ab-like [Anopheles marshallii]|uniref:vitelline membrane protein Vm26Ab-like n=1 Tax=Anopheles marshallii TaxID=1521116 RepID=UPI00237B51AA|nr:vitelline membrane protein Vm26Ab-like [Anopheles marshallii]
MFAKVIIFVAIAVACAAGKPLTAAVVAAPGVVTAQSSQVFARNYNGVAAAYTAPAVVSAAYTAPVAAAYTAPVAAAYTAPVAAAYTAYSSPVAAAYTTAPVAAAYSAPFAAAYTAANYASYYPYVL